MKLYYSPGACSLASHIVAQELGLPVSLVRVDLKAKTFEGQDYRAVNPKGSVPALETDGGELLTEGAVIMQFLSDLKPGAGILPALGTFAHYRCLEWVNFIGTELHKGFSPLFRANTPEEYKSIVRETLQAKLAIVAEAVSDHPYLCGDKFGIADAYLFTILRWAAPQKLDLGQWPSLVSYQERVGKRPSVHAALEAEGQKR